MTYAEQAEQAKIQKEVRAWLLTNPGPLSAHSPEAVYRLAVKRYGEFVRRRLGVFFMRVIEALDAEDKYALAQAQTLAAPFIPTTAPTTSAEGF